MAAAIRGWLDILRLVIDRSVRVRLPGAAAFVDTRRREWFLRDAVAPGYRIMSRRAPMRLALACFTLEDMRAGLEALDVLPSPEARGTRAALCERHGLRRAAQSLR